MKKTMIYLCAIIVVFSLPTVMRGLTAEEVIENMLTAYEKQMYNIEDVKITTGFDIKHMKRTVIDGEIVYMIRTEIGVGPVDKIITIWDGEYQWFAGPDGKVEKQKEKFDRGEVVHQLLNTEAEYVGKADLDGYETHILNVKGLDMQEADKNYGRMDGEVWIDANDWVPRKLELIIPVEDSEDEDKHDSLTVLMEDYRNYEGMLVPLITKMITYPNITPDKQQEMREKLDEMEREFEQMPQEQRELFDSGGMWETHINMMREALETGEYIMAIEVLDVQVNTGLSDDMFDGELLGK